MIPRRIVACVGRDETRPGDGQIDEQPPVAKPCPCAAIRRSAPAGASSFGVSAAAAERPGWEQPLTGHRRRGKCRRPRSGASASTTSSVKYDPRVARVRRPRAPRPAGSIKTASTSRTSASAVSRIGPTGMAIKQVGRCVRTGRRARSKSATSSRRRPVLEHDDGIDVARWSRTPAADGADVATVS